MIETFVQRFVRTVREAERAGVPLSARDFDQISRIDRATAVGDVATGGPWSEAGELAWCNALDDATHMTEGARNRVLDA